MVPSSWASCFMPVFKCRNCFSGSCESMAKRQHMFRVPGVSSSTPTSKEKKECSFLVIKLKAAIPELLCGWVLVQLV